MDQRIYDQAVKKHYPNATNIKDTAVHYLAKMQNDHNIDIAKVTLNTSLCADDTNSAAVDAFNLTFGAFVMGGLAGMPFTGLTGMTAFSHHIPDNGAAFILYGPHIGITQDGTLGQLCRPRMEEVGASCGALKLAITRFEDPDYQPGDNPDDYQQMFLERSLIGYREEILAAEIPIKKVTELTYGIIDVKVKEYVEAVKSEFHVDKAVLLGGILINTPYGIDDYFDARYFDAINLK